MKKNKIKDILDLAIIISFLLMVIIHEVPYIFIFFALSIILIIIDRIFWKCSKCHRYLPIKTWFTDVKCCPYCKTDIEDFTTKNKIK